MVWCFCYVYIHLTCAGTFSTIDALIFINLYAQQGYLVKKRIYGTQRAYPLTERSVKIMLNIIKSISTELLKVKSLPSAERIPELVRESGIAPSSTPCGHIYLQKNGSPIPIELVTTIGSKITNTASITYLI